MNKYVFVLLFVLIFFLGCTSSNTNNNVTIANPASKNCLDLGGNLFIVSGEEGQYGLCVFNGKGICEEWSLFKGECNITDFCGISTFGICNSSNDCIVSGCSNEVCQAKNEDTIMTTCDYSECKNASVFNLSCGCVNSQCAWVSKNLLS